MPGHEEKEENTDTNGAVCNVEGRESDFASSSSLGIEVEEIDHVAMKKSVEQIAGDAAENKAQCHLPWHRMGVKMVATHIEDEQRHEPEDGQHEVAGGVLVEQAPGRACVATMHEVEEPVDHDLFLEGPEVSQHRHFGELIEAKDEDSDDQQAAAWAGFEVGQELLQERQKSRSSAWA